MAERRGTSSHFSGGHVESRHAATTSPVKGADEGAAGTPRECDVKYMVMIYAKQSDYDAMSGTAADGQPVWTEEDLKAMFAHMEAINNDLAETGELVDGQGLSEPAQARLITAGPDGTPVVTDGPYGETKEVLAGYWVLDCESIERVTEIAGRVLACPQPDGVPAYPVVVRPIPTSAPCDDTI